MNFLTFAISDKLCNRLAQLLRLIFGLSFWGKRLAKSTMQCWRLSNEPNNKEQTSWWTRRAEVRRELEDSRNPLPDFWEIWCQIVLHYYVSFFSLLFLTPDGFPKNIVSIVAGTFLLFRNSFLVLPLVPPFRGALILRKMNHYYIK